MTKHGGLEMPARFVRRFGAAVITVSLFGCGGGSGGGAVPAQPVAVATSNSAGTNASNAPSVPSAADFQRVASALSTSQRSDGAIPYTATYVNPYFANIAATG